MKKFISALAVAAALAVAPASSAKAAPVPTEERSIPVTCYFERWYPGWHFCKIPWTYSIKEECDWNRKHDHANWLKDPVCQRLYRRAYNRNIIFYTVKPGDTLWHIAEVFTGNGQNWRKIAKANNIKNHNIWPGMILIIKRDYSL